jgi:hypothetical protein
MQYEISGYIEIPVYNVEAKNLTGDRTSGDIVYDERIWQATAFVYGIDVRSMGSYVVNLPA